MVKVLVIDNDRDMCRIISDVLEEEGIGVNITYKGEDALKKIQRQAYDLMILDYKLSGISGLTVLEKVKYLRPQTQVIMVSAFGDSSTKARAKELGASDFIDKPFNINRLVKAVKKALKKKGGHER